MSDLLYRAFLENESMLVDDIMKQLRNSTSRHYQELEWDVLRRRVQSLVAYFLISLREKPGRFVDYVAELAAERCAEGYCLEEVLQALRILEEKAWIITIEAVPVEGQVRSLSRVTGTVGAAKDRMAVYYVEHAAQLRSAMKP